MTITNLQIVTCEDNNKKISNHKDIMSIFQAMRHPNRIRSSDIIKEILPNCTYIDSPDGALIVARGKFNDQEILVLGQQKPKGIDFNEAAKVNYGMMKPEGYRFAMKMLDIAESEKIPVVTFIDTPGADPSEHSAKNLQSWCISDCITKFCTVKTPTISFIIGEGGSGGALALQVTDKRFMLENALYSVIAPESCGSIIFRDNTQVEKSLNLLKPTAYHMLELGIIDEIIEEPSEGAHVDYKTTIENIKEALSKALAELKDKPIKTILDTRYERLITHISYRKETSKLETKKANPKVVSLEKVQQGKVLIISKLREHDNMDGVAYAYLIKSLQERGLEDSDTIYLCSSIKGGCGRYLRVEEFLSNYKSCPHCGHGERLTVNEWISCISDPHSFMELDAKLSVDDLKDNCYFTEEYRKTLKENNEATGFNDAIVTGVATIENIPVVLAISNFDYMGGSLGSVAGERLVRAIEYASKKGYPVISVCCSGGARMQEGTLSLIQMAKANMALAKFRASKGLFISILADPSTGGSLASYATQGDIIITEPKALISFAGPRVLKLSNINVNPEILTAESVYKFGGVDEITSRKTMKRSLSKYIKLYFRYQSYSSPIFFQDIPLKVTEIEKGQSEKVQADLTPQFAFTPTSNKSYKFLEM